MKDDIHTQWAYLSEALDQGRFIPQAQTGGYPPVRVDHGEDKETDQVVQIWWEAKKLRWSKRPSYEGEMLDVTNLPWKPFPEPSEDRRIPWREDQSPGGRK